MAVLVKVNPGTTLGLVRCAIPNSTNVNATPSHASLARVNVCKAYPRKSASSANAATINIAADPIIDLTIAVQSASLTENLSPRPMIAITTATTSVAKPSTDPIMKSLNQPL